MNRLNEDRKLRDARGFAAFRQGVLHPSVDAAIAADHVSFLLPLFQQLQPGSHPARVAGGVEGCEGPVFRAPRGKTLGDPVSNTG